MLTGVSDQDYDFTWLDRELDKTKTAVFLGKNAAFLGSLMCSLTFMWTKDLPTAGTDGIGLFWNPDYFLELPPDSRKTDLMHELWHAALLHHIRRGARDPKVWNLACDIKIDLMLEAEGYTFQNIQGVLTMAWLTPRKYVGWVEEDIYDDIMANNPPPSGGGGGGRLDILPVENHQKQAAINIVVQAVQSATVMGQAGNIPGAVTETLKKFLEPVVPWETVLMQWFTDLLEEDYTWARPNRRYAHMYLPSRFTDDGRLEHLNYYLDVSGSISGRDILRFNSEVKYVQTVLNPKRLTLIQFDTRITATKEFKEDEPFDEIKIVGRGGTCLAPVREHIQQTKPTAAVIFSDLCVAPMEPLDEEIPIVWIATGNPGATVPFGKLIHIK